jgi:hypothetical protein
LTYPSALSRHLVQGGKVGVAVVGEPQYERLLRPVSILDTIVALAGAGDVGWTT